MTTDKKTNYDKDENKLIEIVDTLTTKYNLDLNDIIDILKDNIDFDDYCENPYCLKKGCAGDCRK